MTFFYDLNKKLDEIRATPSTTHSKLNEHSVSASQPKSKLAQTLNERDMGKHNNATTGFAALAKKAGKEYGSKAAGERVAGAQFQKMKKSGKLEEKDMEESAFQAAIGKKKYGNEGMKALQKAGRDHASDKTMSNIRNKYDKYDEGMGDAVKKVGGMAKKVGGAVLNKLGHGSDQDMRKDLQRKMGVPPTGKKPEQKTDEAAKYRDPKYKDKLYTQEPPDYNDTREYDNARWNPKPDDYAGRKRKIGGGEFGHNDPLRRGDGIGRSGIKNNILDRGPRKGLPSRDQITSLKGSIKSAKGTHAEPNLPEAGAPMTAKQKSFAALAPPKDKITFADKIAGAKKEVDEMLGDVAAEAIKSALSPKQKKIDMNKNGKLDANDFAMLRKGGNKQVADEGFDDMEKDVKNRMSARRVGDVTHGDKHDTQEIPGGRRVTRRVDPNTGYSVGADSDAPADGEKRGRGRPKGADKGPERVTGKATKHKGGRKMADEEFDPADRGEYDQEGEMAKDSIKTVVRHAQALEKILGDNDNLPEWVQSKLAKIESMMTAVDDYMQNQDSDQDDEMSVGEEKTPTRDNRAERAGRKVTKDIEYDEKKKDSIHGAKRGSEDARAEKAGKKVAKDIEHDEKKKKVKEQGGTDTPTASSGFSYGQGIYDSMNRELETMIRESMNISMSMNTDANGGPSKSITVTATDDDALKLGELLKNAGLGGHDLPHVEGGADLDHPGAIEVNGTMDAEGAEDLADQIRQAMGDHGHEHDGGEVCADCGQEECGCEQEVDEAYGDDAVSQNSPDFPSNTETSHDAFQYSGGLNKPKSSGMATIPVTDVQFDGEDKFASIARLREMAGIKEAKKPDFLDVDKDGDKKEPFKKAVDDKKAAGDKKVAEGLMAELARFKKA